MAISQLLQTLTNARDQWSKVVSGLCSEFGINTSERNLLDYLTEFQPRTISEIARQKGVSRQHIQGLVQQLLDKSLLDLQDNPTHKRSMLVVLAPAGEQVIKQVIEKEQHYIESLSGRFLDEDLELTNKTLHALSMLLRSSTFKQSDKA